MAYVRVAFADVESCMGVDPTSNAPGPAALAAAPVSKEFSDKATQLQRVTGATSAIIVVDLPGRGIASALAPCSALASSSYVITVDAKALARRVSGLPRGEDLILAHELSHVLQYRANPAYVHTLCSRLAFDVKLYELLADFGAGYIMYKQGLGQSRQIFAQTVASLADYEFTNVNHHGTVTERLNAYDFGETVAASGKSLDMAALMRNGSAFMQFLAGPSEREASRDYQQYLRRAIEAIYQ